MNTEPDTNTSATTDGDELDPTEAAAILAQATRQAKLEFDPTPPWRLVAIAFVTLLAYGAIWLSVRGQHPYGGPSAWALLIIVGAAGAGLAAAKENRLDLGTALAIVGAGAICAYAGPVGVWLATGIILTLTPGNLITHLRKLEGAGYVSTEKTGNGTAGKTTVALTGEGRKALDDYTQTLRDLLDGL